MTRNTNTKIPPEERPEVDKGRKPYYEGKSFEELDHREFLHGGDGGGSYQTMMRRQPYLYSRQAQLKHSEFKRTYASDEFIEMEGFADLIQLIEFNPWEVSFDFERPPGESGGSSPGGASGGQCSVSCSINLNDHEWNDDCSELRLYFKGEFSEGSYESVYPRVTSHPVVRADGKFGFPQGFLVNEIGSGEEYNGVFYQDIQAFCPGSSIDCAANIDLSPDCCSLVWDEDNSDEEMDTTVDVTADVVVIGGDGSYDWTVTGAGASLADATTTVPSNVVNLTDGVSCGTIIVTCTSCGQSAGDWGIRVTNNGSWCGWTECEFANPATCPTQGPGTDFWWDALKGVYDSVHGKYWLRERTTWSAVNPVGGNYTWPKAAVNWPGSLIGIDAPGSPQNIDEHMQGIGNNPHLLCCGTDWWGVDPTVDGGSWTCGTYPFNMPYIYVYERVWREYKCTC